MYYQARLIDLLDRKFEFVNSLPPSDFLPHLAGFVDFVRSEETIEPHVRQLCYEWEQRASDYQEAISGIKDQVIKLRQDLVAFDPSADDSRTAGPDDPAFLSSLAYFDAVASGSPPAIPMEVRRDMYAPPPVINTLIAVLKENVQRLKQEKDSVVLGRRLDELWEQLCQTHRDHVGYCRLSPGYALAELEHATEYFRRNPSPYPPISALLLDHLFESASSHSQRSQLPARVQDTPSSSAEGDASAEVLTEQLKVCLCSAYEGIRAAIGSHLMHREVLSRYKARCMWYDRERIAKLAADNPGRREEALTRDLALYLFDNGVSTLYRLKRDLHEFDLIGDQAKARIFVEVKAYESSKNTRSQLTAGIAQLHAYINALEADALPVTEIYYTVFRMGGPLYDLPLEIPTNRHTFYPIVIDIGSSRESGSRQPRPISVPLSDFFAEMKSS